MRKAGVNTTTTPSQRATIYRKAAQILEKYRERDTIPGACSAISQALHPRMDRHNAYYRTLGKTNFICDFEDLFAPEATFGGYWGEEWADDHEERRNCRVVALCLMAAMVERP